MDRKEIACSYFERVTGGMALETACGKRITAKYLVDASGQLRTRQRDAAELQVVPHGQRAEQVASLRHEGDTESQQVALRHAVDDLACEAHFAGARRRLPRRPGRGGRARRAAPLRHLVAVGTRLLAFSQLRFRALSPAPGTMGA